MIVGKVPVSQWPENNEVTHETLLLLCDHYDILYPLRYIIISKPTNYNFQKQ